MENATDPARRSTPTGEVTRLLAAWSAGDPRALDTLIPLIYGELRRLAARSLARESPGHTLQPTAVVHEAYLRLVDQKRATWRNRNQFFAVAAQTMRRLLVDYARRRNAAKRGKSPTRIPLETARAAVPAPETDVLALDRALEKLAALDAHQAKVVELRCFGGLTLEETADVLGTSPSTVSRSFRLARAWLYRELSAA